MSGDELAREARRVYEEAHPTPLFQGDTAQVISEKGVMVHLLEQDKKAEFLEKDNQHLTSQLRVKNIENANLGFQISKYKVDSIANEAIKSALSNTIFLKEKEMISKEQASRKEINRWKGNTALAIGAAILAILASILL